MTRSEKPETFEHAQEGSEVTDSVMFDRHIREKGSLSIPERMPAVDTLVPMIFLKVILVTIGRALGSYLSSGWLP